MEITQLKGPKVGQKHRIKPGENCSIHFNKGVKLLAQGQAGVIENKGGKKILNPFIDEHIELNSKKVDKPTEIGHGDTISVGKNKDNVFAIHTPGAKLEKKDLKKHIEKAGIELEDHKYDEIIEEIQRRQKKFIMSFAVFALVTVLVIIGLLLFLLSTKSELSENIKNIKEASEVQITEINNKIGESEGEIENLKGESQLINEKIKGSDELTAAIQSKIGEIDTDIVSLKENDNKLKIIDELQVKLSEVNSLIEDLESGNKKNEYEIDFLETELDKVNDIGIKLGEIESALEIEKEIEFGEHGEGVGDAIRKLLYRVIAINQKLEKGEMGNVKGEITNNALEATKKEVEIVEDEGEMLNGSKGVGVTDIEAITGTGKMRN